MNTDNPNVLVRPVGEKGRGIVAACDIPADELISRAPVKVLGDLEFQMLRMMPALDSFTEQTGLLAKEPPLVSLMHGLQTLLSDPDAVLGCDQSRTAAKSSIMYMFVWDRPEAVGGETAAIVFGVAGLCNHAKDAAKANAVMVQHTSEEQMDMVSTRPIKEGEEILIRYRSVPFADDAK